MVSLDQWVIEDTNNKSVNALCVCVHVHLQFSLLLLIVCRFHTLSKKSSHDIVPSMLMSLQRISGMNIQHVKY